METRVSAVSSGSLAIDDALGVGGLPRGRIVEIYGPESSGKTTVALHAVAMVQQHGGTAAYIDAENAMDPKYAAALGVNIDELLLSQPDTGEQGLEIADELVASGAIDILVVDSVAALVPRAEIEGDMGDAHVGLQARLMSQALRKLSGAINKTKTIALFINQIREKVGIVFGNPEITPGGRALKFYATVRMEVRRSEQIKTVPILLAIAPKSKWLKIKLHRRLRLPLLILCMVKVFPKVVNLSTWRLKKTSLKRRVRGMPTKASALVKDVSTLKAILKRMRSCAEPLKNKSGLLMECRRITLSIKQT